MGGLRPIPALRERDNKLGDGRLGEVRRGVNIPVGTAGGCGKSTAFLLEAASQALLRKVALGAQGWPLGLSRNVLTLNRMRSDIPFKVNGTGRYILSVAACGERHETAVRGPTHSVPYF